METQSFWNGVEQVIDRRGTRVVWSGVEIEKKAEILKIITFTFFFAISELNRGSTVV